MLGFAGKATSFDFFKADCACDSGVDGKVTAHVGAVTSLFGGAGLTDENFASNASGVAIKYKLWGFEQLVCAKERKFKNALQSRLQLITVALNLKGHSFDWQEIKPSLTRNLPANVLEQSQIVANLKDLLYIIPLKELFAQLPFIKDPQAAAKEAEEKLATKTDLTPAA